MRGLIAAAALTILSMPGCEQPTRMARPSGVSSTSDSSRSSSVPGLSETSATRWTPGAICRVLSTSWMFALGHAEPSARADATGGGAEREGAAQPGVEVAFAEGLLQRREGRLAGAVARRDVGDLVGVAQARDGLFDLRVLRDHEVEAACDEVNARVDRRARRRSVLFAAACRRLERRFSISPPRRASAARVKPAVALCAAK